jgi:hypothetical protein
MRYLASLAVAAALACISACGGGEYQPPPKANGLAPANINNSTGGGAAKGQSYATEFNSEASKAQTAWKSFAREKSADNYAICGAHIHNALRYRIMHEANGHTTSNLRGVTELNRLRKDWSGSEGQLTTEQKEAYKEHPEYKKAFEEYQKVQS